MKNKQITLQTILDVMNSRFEKIDKRLDIIEERLDAMDNRLDAMDNRLDAMDKRLDTMDNRLDAMDNRLDAMDKRLDTMDKRLNAMDKRLDNMDIRITRIDADNKEAHEKILEELQKQGNTLTRIETDYGNKIAILFDANAATNDRMDLFRNQQLRFAEQLEKFSYRLSSVEKAIGAKK